MQCYADYQFYNLEYANGNSAVFNTAESFLPYSRKATQYIKRYTFGNVPQDVPESVKMCCCELSEKLYSCDKIINRGISSESVGDLSISYESSVTLLQQKSQEIEEIIYNWLSETGLLYRGVYDDN